MNRVPLSHWVEELESGARPKGGIKDGVGEVPSLGAEHLSDNGGFNFSKDKRIPIEFYRSMKKGRTRRDDILVVKDGATTGKVSFVGPDFPYSEAAINEHVFRVSVSQNRADPRFVFRYLQSPGGQQQIMSDFRGATVGGIGRTFVDKVFLPDFDLNKQRRIAGILDKADTIRRKREEVLAMADDFLRSSFGHMFFSSEANWPMTRIKDVAELINGDRSSNYPSGPDIVNDGVLFVSTKNIVDSKLSLHTKAFITPDKFRSLTRGKLKRNDLIVTLRGSVGQVAVFDCEYETGFINAQLMIVRPDEAALMPAYLLQVFTHSNFQNELLAAQSGSAIPQLTAGQIGRMEIPLPPISVQKQFELAYQNVENLMLKLRNDVDHAKRLFSSLSQRAFGGEL